MCNLIFGGQPDGALTVPFLFHDHLDEAGFVLAESKPALRRAQTHIDSLLRGGVHSIEISFMFVEKLSELLAISTIDAARFGRTRSHFDITQAVLFVQRLDLLTATCGSSSAYMTGNTFDRMANGFIRIDA